MVNMDFLFLVFTSHNATLSAGEGGKVEREIRKKPDQHTEYVC